MADSTSSEALFEVFRLGLPLEPPHQYKDKKDEQDYAETTGRIHAPSRAVGPGGKRTDQENDENDEEKSSR
jgi:hypothetical protein